MGRKRKKEKEMVNDVQAAMVRIASRRTGNTRLVYDKMRGVVVVQDRGGKIVKVTNLTLQEGAD